MSLLPLLLLACQTEAPVLVQPISNPAPTAVAPVDDAPPPGRIGGEPILPQPIVLGAIDVAAVEAGLAPHRTAIDACYQEALQGEPGLAGKVLVKFHIQADGNVREATTKSTSLRHPAAESCLLGVVGLLRFAPLAEGGQAIVSYPFVFGPP